MQSLTPPGCKTSVMMDWDETVLMTGKERFPIMGTLLSEEIVEGIVKDFEGLKLYADCADKIRITQQSIHIGTILTIGAIRIWDAKGRGCYGFDFNPPFECHYWLSVAGLRGAIIDLSLPGVILRALKFKDDEGPIVEGRVPAYLAGHPPQWVQYAAHEYIIDPARVTELLCHLSKK